MIRLTPVKSIHAFCVTCAGGVRFLDDCGGEEDCPLYPYRKGKNPTRKGVGGSPVFSKSK